jgi:hypothetical protein
MTGTTSGMRISVARKFSRWLGPSSSVWSDVLVIDFAFRQVWVSGG